MNRVRNFKTRVRLLGLILFVIGSSFIFFIARKINGLHPYISQTSNKCVRREIFFLETSGRSNLNARQACAVESAARQNLEMSITVYFTSPKIEVDDQNTRIATLMPNVKLEHLQMDSIVEHSPIAEWYREGRWLQSEHKIAHLSDAFRLLILWQKGGIYLDLDVIVMKPLEELVNSVGMEDDDRVCNAVMIFDKHHSFLKMCMKEFVDNYYLHEWASNGPVVLTHVLKRTCNNVIKLSDMTNDICQGVTVLPKSAFYVVEWQNWTKFFDSKHTKNVLDTLNDSYLVHTWNRKSSNTPIVAGFETPYELLAQKYCPLIYFSNKDNDF